MKYQVEKSINVNVPISSVRSFVEDFSKWNSWSPWTIIEPSCPIEIQGKPKSSGHTMKWDGKIIGSGRNTVRSYSENEICYDLEFLKPWKSKAETRFKFDQIGDQTKVTWTMNSSMPFFMFFMVKIMKNWIGMDYDRGLRMLKAVSEDGVVECETTTNGVVDYQGFSYIGIKRSISFSEMESAMKKDFEQLVSDIVVKAEKSAKHWVCVYPKFDMKNMQVTYIAAVSDENLADVDLGSAYTRGQIKSGKMFEVKHHGPYDFLGNAWSMGMMHMRAHKYKAKGFPFEQYWNSPMEVEAKELKTSIFFPIK